MAPYSDLPCLALRWPARRRVCSADRRVAAMYGLHASCPPTVNGAQYVKYGWDNQRPCDNLRPFTLRSRRRPVQANINTTASVNRDGGNL